MQEIYAQKWSVQISEDSLQEWYDAYWGILRYYIGSLFTMLGVDILRAPSLKADSFALRSEPPYTKRQKLLAHFKSYCWLYLFLVPTLIWYAVFCYAPMGGIVVAFKRYTGALSIWESKWVGIKWFKSFFNSYFAKTIITNTLVLSFYGLLTFPLPILVALMINEVRNAKFQKAIQTIMYAPHFISTVVLVSMLRIFFADSGLINMLLQNLGEGSIKFLTSPEAFPHLYTWSYVWQDLGWNCIIYVAALSSVDPALHEAATLDGASRLQRIWHINIPTIMPTIMVTLIMRVGNIMASNTDKVLLMINDLNADTAEVIGSFVYDRGLVDTNYGYATAVGLFTNVVNLILLLTVNAISKKVTKTSLF